MKRLIFTYGTLMKGQCRNNILATSKYICDAVLDNYGLYEVGSYPAAVPVKGFKVYGEVYEIDDSLKSTLDEIEGEGFLYKYKEVQVYDASNIEYKVGFYEYLEDTSKLKLRLPVGKWNTENQDINNNYAWYACYGSNLCQERFDLYLKEIKDKYKDADIKIYDQKKYEFSYPIYFSWESSGWFHKGVCFLDTNSTGKSYGWMYLVNINIIGKLSEAEGRRLYPVHPLEIDENGYGVFTVTYPTIIDKPNKASDDYYTVIARGLKDRYGLDNDNINKYLHTNIQYDLSDEHIKKILDDYEKRKKENRQKRLKNKKK